jgi:3-phenylpropionate/trans-cinnamate dioxygenase ferredoxin component
LKHAVMADWSDVALVKNFGPGKTRLINIGGVDIAVINLAGEYFAIEDVCSHDESPMLGCGLEAEDVLNGDEIICPRHGASFNIKTGAPLTPPAYESIATFPTRIFNGMVQIRYNRDD